MKKSRIIALVITLAFVFVMVAGCAPATTQDTAGTTPTPAPNTPDTAASQPENTDDAVTPDVEDEADAAKGGAVERIKAAGKLVMLTNAQFPPFEYLGDDGKPAGVDVDIATYIAEELGVELEVVDMEFDPIVMSIQTGKGDLGVAGMTNTEERRQNVDFSINYLNTTQMIIVQEGSDIQSVEDLAGKSIGVQLGTTGDLYTSEYVEGAEVVRFKTGPDAGIALANGQIDAVVIDAMPADQIVAANTGLKLLEEPLTEEQYAIAIAKENTDLKAVVDAVLEKLLAEGIVDALIEKHMTD